MLIGDSMYTSIQSDHQFFICDRAQRQPQFEFVDNDALTAIASAARKEASCDALSETEYFRRY